ncbi:hypothetical protein ASC87_28580 [Rhizobacter sp. Root1221]|nr:hypothetical protein ASC87_28580 [Rhizobacter sp. Root1221]
MILTAAVVREIKRLGLPPNDDFLFPAVRGTGKPFAVAKSFERLLRRAGLNEARLHDMRHTVGSTLAREGRSAVEIATVLGHKTLEVVKRYSHINVKAKAGIVRASALAKLR